MIYCVVPEELAPELYDRLADYYADDPNVEGHHRPPQGRAPRPRGRGRARPQQRELRDRRRARVPGEFPPIDAADAIE